MQTGLGFLLSVKYEFLVFPGLTEGDRQLFQTFLQQVEVLSLTATDVALIHRIIEVRQQYRLKLPDAVIAAMTLHYSASLVTADQAFSKVSVLSITRW
jgi:hypothetical protein